MVMGHAVALHRTVDSMLATATASPSHCMLKMSRQITFRPGMLYVHPATQRSISRHLATFPSASGAAFWHWDSHMTACSVLLLAPTDSRGQHRLCCSLPSTSSFVLTLVCSTSIVRASRDPPTGIEESNGCCINNVLGTTYEPSAEYF